MLRHLFVRLAGMIVRAHDSSCWLTLRLSPTLLCRGGRGGEEMRKQAGKPDDDQIDRDQIIQQPRQDQYQYPEQQRDQRLDHDDVYMHVGISPVVSVCYNAP